MEISQFDLNAAISKFDIYWQMILSLIILAAIAIYKAGTLNLLPQIAVAVVVASFLDIIIKKYKTKYFQIPKSAIITGLLIGTILDPATPLAYAAALSAVAIILKYLLAIDGRNTFNPAALGLAIGAVLLNAIDLWTIASNLIVVIILGALILYRIKRIQTALVFLIVYYLLIATTALYSGKSISGLIGIVSNPIVLFFAAFMLIEHKTSPYSDKGALIYGGLVGMMSFAFSIYIPTVALIAPLLIGNFISVFINRYMK